MSILLPSLIFIGVVFLFLLAYLLWLKVNRLAVNLLDAKDRILKINEQRCEQDLYIREIEKVLNRYVGGIGKRLNESKQIAEALQLYESEIFKKCPAVAYWLHANDQFLMQLYTVCTESIDVHQKTTIKPIQENNRGEIFSQIYHGAGLLEPGSNTKRSLN